MKPLLIPNVARQVQRTEDRGASQRGIILQGRSTSADRFRRFLFHCDIDLVSEHVRVDCQHTGFGVF